MAGAIERLEFLLSLNADGAIKGFKNVGDTADEELGKADNHLDKVAGGMTKFGTAALAGAVVVGAALFSAGESASNLGEAVSKTNVIFGDAADSVIEFAKHADVNLGLSEVAALDAATSFAQLGKAAGLTGPELGGFSTDLTTLAGDLASFSNTTPEEAVLALGSALRGEAEPIRKYGVLLDDATLKAEAATLGIYDGSGALTQQQKILAAQSSIMKQTADAQGDFARTSDGAANSQRKMAAQIENAKASLGESLAPVIATVTSSIGKLAGGFSAANEATGGMLGKLAGIATVGVGVIGAISAVAGQAIKMRDRFVETTKITSTLTDAATGLETEVTSASRSLTTTGKASVVAAAAMAALALVMASQAAHAKDVAENNANAAAAIAAVAGASDTKAVELWSVALKAGAFAGRNAADVNLEFATTNLAASKRVLELATASGIATTDTDSLRTAIAAAEETTRQAEVTTAEFGATVDDVGSSKIPKLASNVKTAKGALGDLADTTEDLGKTKMPGLAVGADSAKDALSHLTDATQSMSRAQEHLNNTIDTAITKMQALRDKGLEGVNAQRDFEKATDDADSAVAAYTAVLGDHKSTLEDVDDAARDAEDAVIGAAEAYSLAGGAARGSAADIQGQIDFLTIQASTLAPGSPLRQRIDAYIWALASIPLSIPTTITATTDFTQAFLDLDLLRQRTRSFNANVAATVTLQSDPKVHGATGGIVTRPTMALIGEAGPEAVIPLNQMPGASPLGALGGGGTTVINITTNADPNQVIQAIKRYIRNGGVL